MRANFKIYKLDYNRSSVFKISACAVTNMDVNPFVCLLKRRNQNQKIQVWQLGKLIPGYFYAAFEVLFGSEKQKFWAVTSLNTWQLAVLTAYEALEVVFCYGITYVILDFMIDGNNQHVLLKYSKIL